MNIIQVNPVSIWSANGTAEANFIKLLPSLYSFKVGDMSVNYELLNGTPTSEDNEAMTFNYLTGGAVVVPTEIVEKWVDDMQIFDYIISQLKLTKV